jgi:hypothetical protein
MKIDGDCGNLPWPLFPKRGNNALSRGKEEEILYDGPS